MVGGGIVGACVARDAALRGLSVALIERNDFCSGTSAASSRMIHGGVRYLAQLQLKVVRESLRERHTWQRIAPHLVHPLPFALPAYGWRQRLEASVGLSLFDALARERTRFDDPDQRLSRHEWWSAATTRQRLPLLRATGLSGAVCYMDCQAYSPERICMDVLDDATRHGAIVVNYVSVERIVQRGGRVTGLKALDRLTNERMTVTSRSVVNAAGPWAAGLMDSAQAQHPPLARSKGAHIVVPSLVEPWAITVLEANRHAFILPWRGHSIIGTTDTAFAGDPDDVWPDAADIDALLDITNASHPTVHLTPGDVRAAYAGLRPLVGEPLGGTYRMSRRAEIVDHASTGLVGLVSALGGKWTTARHVAEQCVDVVARHLGVVAPCQTAVRRLPAGDFERLATFRDAAIASHRGTFTPETIRHLVRLYGTRVADLAALVRDDPSLGRPLADGCATLAVEVVSAVRHEHALHLTDVLLRRTELGTLGPPPREAISRTADLMAREAGWSAARLAEERTLADRYYAHALAGTVRPSPQ